MSINLGDDLSPVDIQLPSDRPISRKGKKLAKKRKNHTDALATTQASFEKTEKINAKKKIKQKK